MDMAEEIELNKLRMLFDAVQSFDEEEPIYF